MTDKELLEAAARAGGFDVGWHGGDLFLVCESRRVVKWNPLTDDGDALRLAVKLRIDVDFHADNTVTTWSDDWQEVAWLGDPYAATRRAIVRAAATLAPQVSLPLSDAKEGSEDSVGVPGTEGQQ